MSKKKIIISVVSIITLLSLVLVIVPSIAKYVKEQGNQSKLDSEKFYFTSNYLVSDEIPEYEIFGNSVTFEIRNYMDNLRINDNDINFVVETTDGVVSITSGTLLKDNKNKTEISLTYAFQGDETQKEINISVIGTGQYTKTLKAKFIFIKPVQLIKYYIEDSSGSNYAVLYISSAQTDMIAYLTWDTDKLIIDETNDYVYGNITYDGETHTGSVTTKTIAANTTAKIVFFKKNLSDDYSCSVTSTSDGSIIVHSNIHYYINNERRKK